MASSYQSIAGSSNAQVTAVSDRFIGVTDKDGNMVYKQGDYFSVGDRKQIVAVQPKTQIPSDLSSAQVDFDLNNRVLDVCDYITLELNMFNAGATGGVSCGPTFLKNYDIIGPNGTVIFTSHGQEIYQNLFIMDTNTYGALASQLDLNATTYAMNVTQYGSGATARLLIPCFGFFKACKFPLCCLANAITVRFYFNPSSVYLASGSTFTCSSMQLYVHGRKLKQMARDQLINTFYNGRIPMSLSHLSVDRQVITQSLVASTNYQWTLSALRGVCAYLTISVRLASTATTTAPVTYLSSTSYDILDQNGNSLTGGIARNRDLQKLHYAQVLGNGAMVNTGINFISFCVDPKLSFSKGANTGFCVFTGNELLSFTTGSATTSASHIIDIRAWMYESVYFNDGVLKAIRD